MVRILFIFLTCSSAFGQAFTLRDPAFTVLSIPVAGCSGTTVLTNNAFNNANVRLGDAAGSVYRATWFVPLSNMTVVTISPLIRGLTAAPAYNFRAGIFSSDANTNPVALVGSWSGYMPGTSVNLTTYVNTNMPAPNNCATLVSGTRYFVVLNANAVDASNGLLWGYNTGVSGPQRGILQDGDAAGTWAVLSQDGMHGFKLLGGP